MCKREISPLTHARTSSGRMQLEMELEAASQEAYGAGGKLSTDPVILLILLEVFTRCTC